MCKNTVRWLYKVDQDFTWRSPFSQDKDSEFRDRTGKAWLRLTRDGGMTILKDYAWDGCTPKLCVLDLLFGTPDGAVDSSTGRPKTYYASLIHDALCQFLADGLPLTRLQVDRCFFLLMEERGFALRYVYYAVVLAFGWLTKPITRRIRHSYGGQRVELSS